MEQIEGLKRLIEKPEIAPSAMTQWGITALGVQLWSLVRK